MPSLVLLQRDHEASPRLRTLIQSAKGFTVQALAHTVKEARPHLLQHPPDLLVTDLRVQDGPVFDLLAELHQSCGRMRPHVLVTLLAQDDAAQLAALRGGADSYWVHTAAPTGLRDALAHVVRGESVMSPTMARQVLTHFDKSAAFSRSTAEADAHNPQRLTGIERDILLGLAQGYLIEEMAQRWQASVHSLACGVRRVVGKLQFELRASALALVV